MAEPMENVVESATMIPHKDVPVYATINGKRVRVGTGHINPDTMIFTTMLNKKAMDMGLAKKFSAKGSYGGMVHVSQVTLTTELTIKEK